MPRLARDPLFQAGLAIRLVLIGWVVPQTSAIWFVPFLKGAVWTPSIDPWSAHLAAGGDPMAFPYGPVMYLFMAPGAVLGTLLDRLLETNAAAQIGFGFGILAADVLLLLTIMELARSQGRKVLLLYWLSPLVLYICYWHGQIDVLPVLLLTMSLLLLRRLNAWAAGAVMGVAVAAKLSMVMPVPFVLLYLYRNRRLRALTLPFALGLGLAVALLQAPYLLSAGVQQMVLGTPEMDKIYNVAVRLDERLQVYVLPLVYLVMLFAAWRVRRMSFDLLIAILGLAFFLVLLLTPASPGWFLWVMPFLVLHQLGEGRTGIGLVTGFSLLFIAFNLLESTGAAVPALGLNLRPPLATLIDLSPHFSSLVLSLLVATGVVLSLRLAREGVQRNDYYRLSRRPLVIGVAGDSGAGKDTLAEALAGLFGAHSVAGVSGDDYHLWDRHKPMWETMTHLHPRANDLYQFATDVLALADGKSVRCRQYDHGTGRFTPARLIAHNDVIVASGLHALYVPVLRERYDLAIFLEMDEGLRRHFKLARDAGERGHAPERVQAAIEARAADAGRFIAPQARDADLVFSLQPIHPTLLEAAAQRAAIPLKLRVLLRHGIYYESLVRVLIGVCGLHVDVTLVEGSPAVEITIEGDVNEEDVVLAARQLVPHMDELLDLEPKWFGGMTGVMQLMSLAQSVQALRSRLT
jgi:uridine kinase